MRKYLSIAIALTLLVPALAGALSIDLAWDYSFPVPAGEITPTEFRLYRSQSPELATFPTTPLRAGLPAAGRTVSDATVLYATQYCYYVTAATAAIESAPSNVACGTTPAQAPGPATNLRAVIRP
jgi:hypothetical protein